MAPEGENIITTTRSHGTKAVVDAIDACDPTEILRVGGAGHKVCSVRKKNTIYVCFCE